VDALLSEVLEKSRRTGRWREFKSLSLTCPLEEPLEVKGWEGALTDVYDHHRHRSRTHQVSALYHPNLRAISSRPGTGDNRRRSTANRSRTLMTHGHGSKASSVPPGADLLGTSSATRFLELPHDNPSSSPFPGSRRRDRAMAPSRSTGAGWRCTSRSLSPRTIHGSLLLRPDGLQRRTNYVTGFSQHPGLPIIVPGTGRSTALWCRHGDGSSGRNPKTLPI